MSTLPSRNPDPSQTPGLSPEAKARLAAVVRSLRERLLKDLGDAVQSTYRLSLPLEQADLDEEAWRKRKRLEAWLDEEARGGSRGVKETLAQARERHLQGIIKSAAATLLNRLVVLRQAEALGMVRLKVLSGGWESPGYREFRAFAPDLLADETEGYSELLRLVCEEWALDLPGLFGEVGTADLVPLPAATLRAAVEALEDPDLAPAWTDDTTLGWVYQFWNDPDREALDEKIRNRGKLENHEIAAKTQLFTDRYMVEWLLQNSLGQVWFGICARNGWTPEVVTNGTLERLEARRAGWRAKREAGEVDLEALMPLDSDEEERWKYWVPRELPAPASPDAGSIESAENAPASVREVKLLDPACGSGHFLVIAFELLAALYQEEARQRRALGQVLVEEEWEPEAIASHILEENLHGLDLDPRAVQIAAAALWLKARTWCRQGGAARAGWRLPALRLKNLNLVASNLGLAALPPDDPALLELLEAVEDETGIPGRLTRKVVESLKGADHLGSLLKVDAAVEAALEAWEKD
ncbi:MAG: DNA methyltransferase, partial [Candidatus Xenobium sp.]